jgi:hypothetical protein
VDANLWQLIQEAVEKGITSRSWLLMLTLVVSTGLAAFLGSYLKKRGEHQALKEVSKALRDELIVKTIAIENIKGSIAIAVASSTESLKAVIATDLATFQSSLTEAVQFKTGILLPQIEAYKSLWAMTYVVRPTRKDLIADFEKTKLGEDMTAWYYNAGNGIFLSTKAGELWRTARSSLSNLDDKMIKGAFSDLRTQLKIDIRVYGEVEAETELGT